MSEITALRTAQADLRESERRYRDIAELSSEWFWEQDAELRFTHFSNVVPGASHTLRVNGRATLTVAPEILDLLEGEEARPKLGVVVEVDEIFAHCPKAFQRSGLWDSAQWVDPASLPSSRDMTAELKAATRVSA